MGLGGVKMKRVAFPNRLDTDFGFDPGAELFRNLIIWYD
jgi:hypothetical protein